MTIGKRLYTMTLIPLLLSLLLISYIVFQMISFESSSNEDVAFLLEGKEVNSQLISVEQALDTYGYSPSEATRQEALTQIETTGESFENLAPMMETEAQQQWYEQAQTKYEDWQQTAVEALQEEDNNEVQRQASRTAGILNDIFMLQEEAQAWYDEKAAAQADAIRNLIIFALASAAVLIALSVFATSRLTSRIAKPIRELAKQASQVADGDLTTRIETSDKEKDEVGQLKRAFQMMVENLTNTLQSVHRIGGNVEEFSSKLNKEMSGLSEVTDQVSSSTEELAQGSQSISNDIQDIASLMEQMNRNFEQNTEESQLASEKSTQALQSAQEGQEAIHDQRQVMERNNHAISNVEGSVTEFIRYTDQIEVTVKLVNEIAEQTNLLALNAAIEAARAGEHGKGFAVVAEEVRKLADQSTKATGEISSMVQQIKSGVTTIEKEMQETMELTEQQHQSLNASEGAFSVIHTQVDSIYQQLNDLVDGMVQSKEQSSQVTSSVENVSAVTEETAAGTEEISASTEEQQYAFNQLQKEANHLEEMVSDLNDQLSHFQWEQDASTEDFLKTVHSPNDDEDLPYAAS
ncbi:putative sensory transducer protein YvaQ [Halobacillus andaensis]|uniref:Sensory transducer protein YvaQ n=1 Tax=Halobacillus andaensis TaxID=1176239 RepID=A0A917BCH3_HALAA|nr:HAMP domain-containing methyl-accepting chemotaxis protein [Halobacillus andaensis]MBP2006220.1 methyl-accepting chemotaxis protein [Halobacillus andaensis]GGF33369.1 putative sensory transducer protein YvaQ [Halobacillus andaensis]